MSSCSTTTTLPSYHQVSHVLVCFSPEWFSNQIRSVGWLLSAAVCCRSLIINAMQNIGILQLVMTEISVMFCHSVRPQTVLSCYHNSNLPDDWLAILQTKSWCDLSLQIQSWIKCKFIIIQPTSPAEPVTGLGLSFCLFLISLPDLTWSSQEREREKDGV